MKDPWKILAFPLAAITGYLASNLTTLLTSNFSVSETLARFALVGGTGLIAGFLIDEVIPAYVEKVRGGSAGAADIGDGDFGGGGGDDMGDMDFG
jgi:hypothetical protein